MLSVHVRMSFSGKRVGTFRVVSTTTINEFKEEIQTFQSEQDTRKRVLLATQLVLGDSCLEGDVAVGHVLGDGMWIEVVTTAEYLCANCGDADDVDSSCEMLNLKFEDLPRYLLRCCKRRLCEECFCRRGGSERVTCPMACGAQKPSYAWSVHTPSAPSCAFSRALSHTHDGVNQDDTVREDKTYWWADEIAQPLVHRRKSWQDRQYVNEKLVDTRATMTVHCPRCKTIWCGVLHSPFTSTSLQGRGEPQVVARGQYSFLAEQPEGFTVPPQHCETCDGWWLKEGAGHEPGLLHKQLRAIQQNRVPPWEGGLGAVLSRVVGLLDCYDSFQHFLNGPALGEVLTKVWVEGTTNLKLSFENFFDRDQDVIAVVATLNAIAYYVDDHRRNVAWDRFKQVRTAFGEHPNRLHGLMRAYIEERVQLGRGLPWWRDFEYAWCLTNRLGSRPCRAIVTMTDGVFEHDHSKCKRCSPTLKTTYLPYQGWLLLRLCSRPLREKVDAMRQP